MRKKNVRDLPESLIRGKRALVRVDFNVPLDEKGGITDDSRIRAALPTIELLLERGARPVILSHLGRPKGKPELKYSLQPVARRLGELMGRKVTFVESTDSDEAAKATHKLRPGEVLLLENTRFLGGEEMNDLRLALYRHLQWMPLRFFTETRTGEIQSRISNDVGGVQSVVTDTAASLLSNFATVATTVIAMWILDWRLTVPRSWEVVEASLDRVAYQDPSRPAFVHVDRIAGPAPLMAGPLEDEVAYWGYGYQRLGLRMVAFQGRPAVRLP